MRFTVQRKFYVTTNSTQNTTGATVFLLKTLKGFLFLSNSLNQISAKILHNRNPFSVFSKNTVAPVVFCVELVVT